MVYVHDGMLVLLFYFTAVVIKQIFSKQLLCVCHFLVLDVAVFHVVDMDMMIGR